MSRFAVGYGVLCLPSVSIYVYFIVLLYNDRQEVNYTPWLNTVSANAKIRTDACMFRKIVNNIREVLNDGARRIFCTKLSLAHVALICSTHPRELCR